jgi:SAM-dependent methyltransferase
MGNAEQAAEWDGPAAEHRIKYAGVFDAQLRPHNKRLLAAAGIGDRDLVLDIGCGTGQSTREAARAAAAGSALGVDLSALMLRRARRLSDEEGLRNVTYVQADAQAHPFPPGHFDVCISRFGVMFFADPVAAFANIGRALRPPARLVLMVWQDRERNEWSVATRQALAGAPAADPPGPNPFSLADPAVARDILTSADFAEISFTDVHERVYYGPDPATACDVVLGLRSNRELLASMDAGPAGRALARLRATLAAHDAGGVFFDSRAWIITARRC